MDLLYKPDWENTKKNYLAWWEHEYFGRCAIAVTAPAKNAANNIPPPLPEKTEDRWLDFGYLAALNEYKLKSTYYGGEAFPDWNPGFPGCDGHVTYLGANVTLKEDTGWTDPLIAGGALTDHDYKSLKINKEKNKWWKFGREVRRLAARESEGKCIPSNMAFGACGDTLAAIRGTEQLLYDMTECPGYVHEFDRYLMRQWIDIYEDSYSITKDGAQGSTCWFNLWSPGKFYAAQNDFAYMISPEMFNEVFLPSIEMQAKYLDHTVYHVDGIGNFRHLDALLGVDCLQAIQILPGAGQPSPLYFMDILKKVQAAKRNLHITIPPNEVKDALDNLSARGLFIQTWCNTEDDARELLKYAEKRSVDRGSRPMSV